MKRNKIIDDSKHHRLQQHKQCIAFHEAGHAAGIYLNNKARNLPPIFFQIIFKEISDMPDYDEYMSKGSHHDCVARVEGGRLIQSLPFSVDGLAHKLIDHNEAMAPLVKDYIKAFEADIINLLVGPLAEAKFIHNRDDELFNHQLVNLKSLENYGGGSDISLVREYIENFSASREQQDEKLHELFVLACDFVKAPLNWKAITELANYILDSDKAIISCEEVASVLQ
ncbi:hypothetical protein [Methylobacter sp. S3L5C]|uniref:hypothetical protein n=1 Tax=Methylobacter sp. S3L5C TaxID=2839024 RepID=UPI001FAD39BE|nr:hypothetical protein [Methylobacter sp. S3L5C]UOA09943.1 hypothetical protein KKZ03_06720 [Methylobacter sp. S3L5C]